MRTAALCLCVVLLQGFSARAEPTNVIFFLVDDWGWTDAGCYGSDLYETPHIDRLASQGVLFTNGYAACTVCSPTRAAVMTGMYPGRTRVTDYIPGMFPGRDRDKRSTYPLMPPDWTQRLEHHHHTIAEALRDEGYRTMHVGKWHLTPRTTDAELLAEYYPDKHGFEINIAGNQWGAPGSYHFPFVRRANAGKLPVTDLERIPARTMNFPETGKQGDYLTDVLTTAMLQALESWKEQPFFVYFPFYNVHTPIQGRADLVDKFRAKVDDDARHTNAEYAAMIAAVDENIGRVLDRLEQWGVADRTAIFLTGDNGGLDRRGNPTDNLPLRAGKGSAYEGGVRVPTIIKWPGAASGQICHEPVVSIDYYPTILQMTGASGQQDHNANVDGESLIPLLKDPDGSLQREAIYWHYPHYHGGGAEPYSAIRAGDWRLVEFQNDGRVELYNLRNDLGEKNDVSELVPATTIALREQLYLWRASVEAQAAVPNPDYIPRGDR